MLRITTKTLITARSWDFHWITSRMEDFSLITTELQLTAVSRISFAIMVHEWGKRKKVKEARVQDFGSGIRDICYELALQFLLMAKCYKNDELISLDKLRTSLRNMEIEILKQNKEAESRIELRVAYPTFNFARAEDAKRRNYFENNQIPGRVPGRAGLENFQTTGDMSETVRTRTLICKNKKKIEGKHIYLLTKIIGKQIEDLALSFRKHRIINILGTRMAINEQQTRVLQIIRVIEEMVPIAQRTWKGKFQSLVAGLSSAKMIGVTFYFHTSQRCTLLTGEAKCLGIIASRKRSIQSQTTTNETKENDVETCSHMYSQPRTDMPDSSFGERGHVDVYLRHLRARMKEWDNGKRDESQRSETNGLLLKNSVQCNNIRTIDEHEGVKFESDKLKCTEVVRALIYTDLFSASEKDIRRDLLAANTLLE
ncbi:hypothetical protein WN51_03049 [Melipona quadrifasciata]|uniref:Uncharacterized protein n=1 Tax=Melipona quadrifasciata TaxID=166423 RepID=A0A0N0BEH7_9HYME|nr:hypothetical protein WN51_03049 [Melipona quadrifasciata]